MTAQYELLSTLCFVVLAFGAARFGWVGGFYLYHAFFGAIDMVAKILINLIRRR